MTRISYLQEGNHLIINTSSKRFALLYILVTMVLSVGGFFMGNTSLIVAACAMLIAFPIVCKSFERAVTVMLVMYFLMDQMSFQILGGTFRVYFFFSIVIIAFFLHCWGSVLASPIMRALIFWVVIGVIFNLVSGSAVPALISFMSTILQMLSGVAVYLLLVSGLIDLSKLDRLFVMILFLMFGFGVVQMVIYKTTGIGVGLNPEVVAGQLAIGQIPSFRYESNTLGKLLGWGVIFCIPPIINMEGKKTRKYKYLLAFLLIFLIISITRAVLYALVVTMIVSVCWYTYRKKGGRFLKIASFLVVLAAVAMLAIRFDIIRIGDYSLYKLENMFLGSEEASQDSSAGYRLQSMKQAVDIWFSSPQSILTGVGYARATADLSYVGGATEAEVGGCDLVSIGVSLGIIGLVLYLRILLKLFLAGLKTALDTPGGSIQQIWSERVLFAAVFYTVFQALSGSLLCPEFWMTFAIGAYCSLQLKYHANDGSLFLKEASF